MVPRVRRAVAERVATESAPGPRVIRMWFVGRYQFTIAPLSHIVETSVGTTETQRKNNA
jgi:hypothetical protein